jgi:thiamine biosynthesis lipoprotein
MISGKSSGKNRETNNNNLEDKNPPTPPLVKGGKGGFASAFGFRPILVLASLLLCFLIIASTSFAQESPSAAPKQFQQNFSIKGRINGSILIVGWPADAASIQKLADMTIAEAERTYDLLDAANPASDMAKLNAGSGKGKIQVSWQTVEAFKAAQKVAQWSKGAFDVVVLNGDYRALSIDEKASTIELKNEGMEVRLDPIIDGYLADYMITLINAAKMQNAMVRVGNVFRGIGESPYGPWRIQVQEDSAAYARHALNLTVSNTGIATISATEFRAKPLMDYRSKKTMAPTCKGATIVTSDGALALGLAYAVFVLGPDDGMKLLNNIGKVRGLIVDSQGKFLKTQGL